MPRCGAAILCAPRGSLPLAGGVAAGQHAVMALTAALALAFLLSPQSQGRDLDALLRRGGPTIQKVMADPKGHRLQVLIGEPEIQPDGRTVLRRSAFGDEQQYYYPASTVKLGAAVAALLELQRLSTQAQAQAAGAAEGAFTLAGSWQIGPRFSGDAEDGPWIPIEEDLRAMLVVSANPPFNHCYELVGPKRLNETLWQAGLESARIWHRLQEPHTRQENLMTRPLTLRQGAVTLHRPARDEQFALDNSHLRELEVGRAHVSGGKVVERPMSCADKNAITVRDLQDLMAMVVRPDIALQKRGFPELSLGARRFLTTELARYPRESPAPRYDEKKYPDDYGKFCLPGLRKAVPAESLRVYAKLGRAYGFSIENDYIEDERTGRGFFLTAVLFTNPDGVMGNDAYDYEGLADPFFAELGELIGREIFGASDEAGR